MNDLDKRIAKLRKYVQWHIDTRIETIEDYAYDDEENNSVFIHELWEELEHWRDVLRILDGKENTFIKSDVWEVEE